LKKSLNIQLSFNVINIENFSLETSLKQKILLEANRHLENDIQIFTDNHIYYEDAHYFWIAIWKPLRNDDLKV
jgi:hypothetical protein